MKSETPAEFQSYRAEKEVKDKSLVLTLSIVFLILAAVSYQKRGVINPWVAGVFVANLSCYFVLPSIYRRFSKLWGKLGLLLHYVVQPVFIGLLFFVVFMPVGLLMRLFGKDPLWLKGKRYNSMWQKPSSSGSFIDQF